MFKHIARKLAIAATFVALVTPAAFATQTGTDPEPRPNVVQIVLTYLGLG